MEMDTLSRLAAHYTQSCNRHDATHGTIHSSLYTTRHDTTRHESRQSTRQQRVPNEPKCSVTPAVRSARQAEEWELIVAVNVPKHLDVAGL